MSVLLDEIERIIDTLPDESKEELSKILQERTQKGSVLEKLKHSMDSEEAAKILLLNRRADSSGQACCVCGIRELCAYYQKDHNRDREPKNCVGGIAEMLDSQFKWGDVYYDALDKYGPDYDPKQTESQRKMQEFFNFQKEEFEKKKDRAAGAAQDTAGAKYDWLRPGMSREEILEHMKDLD